MTTLFDSTTNHAGGVTFTATAAARATDPVTSHIAADKVNRSGAVELRCWMIVSALQRENGLTYREIAARTGLDPTETMRRLNTLELRGAVEKRGTEKINGRSMSRWWIK